MVEPGDTERPKRPRTDAEQAHARAEQARRDASLGALLRTEAHRVLSENMLQPDPARVADGWERRFITDGTRAEEVIALYEELGYEVCADPVRPEELRNECDACRLVALLRFQTIYTRKRDQTEDAS
ncbi:MAG: hypothetical protein P8099_06405 [Gemmatimonadota bacterium]|jgi:hypothetical protein